MNIPKEDANTLGGSKTLLGTKSNPKLQRHYLGIFLQIIWVVMKQKGGQPSPNPIVFILRFSDASEANGLYKW